MACGYRGGRIENGAPSDLGWGSPSPKPPLTPRRAVHERTNFAVMILKHARHISTKGQSVIGPAWVLKEMYVGGFSETLYARNCHYYLFFDYCNFLILCFSEFLSPRQWYIGKIA